MSDAPSGKLKEQDLTNLDVTKLTPSSPQVISRQATINIDSTNENPQSSSSNTITTKKRKMSDSNVGFSQLKVYINSEQNLDKIDAALLNCENSLRENGSFDDSVQRTKESIPTKDACADDNRSSFAANKSSFLKYNAKQSKNSNYVPIDDDEELENSDLNESAQSDLDTATITLPMYNTYLGHFKLMSCHSMIKSLILEGKIVDLLKDKVVVYDPDEIDKIVDDVIFHDERFYLVRWKIWSLGFNTWERFSSLINCQQHIRNYLIQKDYVVNEGATKSVNGLLLILPKHVVCKLFDLFRNRTGICIPIINVDDLVYLLNARDLHARDDNYNQTLVMIYTSIALHYFREKQIDAMRTYENAISALTATGYSIRVQNNVDLEKPSFAYIYSHKRIPTDVTSSEDPPIGCGCKRNCAESAFCCNHMAGYSAAYDANKNVIVSPGHPIFECNKKCKCTDKCRNRVVQLGSNVNVCIYKSRRPYGWAVKTDQNIVEGQFVSEYTGEIITIETAEERLENNYSSLDHMWNLDFDDENNYKYIIDSSHFANYTYHINHSCNANLSLYAVWINCLDLNLPHLALFANRDIAAGEQLTINYFSRSSEEDLINSGVRCHCNMKNCTG